MLSLVNKKGKVEVREIKDRFNLSNETLNSVIGFLVEFGLVRLDESKRYIMLSPTGKKFFEGRT